MNLYVCSFHASGYLSESDLEFLAVSLDKHRGKQFILLMHIPPPTDIHRNHMPVAEWEKLKTVLGPYREKVTHIFCGHLHGYHQYQIDDYTVTITAGGGAAMIYDLKKPGQKIHHAIAIDLHPGDRMHPELLIAEEEAT